MLSTPIMNGQNSRIINNSGKLLSEMKEPNKVFAILFVAICLIPLNPALGQELNVNVGQKKIFKSNILNEEREILVHLPDSYNKSIKSYPVLYRLDGDTDLMIETLATANRLTYAEEIIPEMIIVLVKNTRRDKDMWPVNTRYFPEPEVPGTDSFLGFIGEELLPYIDSNYRTTNKRIICGQSLSSVFVLYTFLQQPGLFNSYIAISGAFPDCEPFFKELIELSLLEKDKFIGRKLFITNGMNDPLDPNGEMHREMDDFRNLLNSELGDQISLKYVPYLNEGHVPFPSLYDALRFIY